MADGEALMTAGGLATPLHRIAETEVAELLRGRYGLVGSLMRFDTEKDDTYLVRTDDGRQIVLKVANALEDEREIALQAALLQHLESVDPELPVPRVVPTNGGAAYFRIEDGSHRNRIVRALSFLEGTPLDRVNSTARERELLGGMLARLRLAMSGFSHPHDGRTIAWDVKHLARLGDLVVHVDDPAQRRALELGLSRFASLEAKLAACRTQVLHNDATRSNIVVDRAQPGFVTGIIDFGDVVRTAIAIDVSSALLNQLPRDASEDLFADGKDLLRGYLRVADLTEAELALIPHLVMGRVIARALITTWRAARFPENAPYILRNTHQGWAQLDWFLSRSVEEVSGTLTDAGSDRHIRS